MERFCNWWKRENRWLVFARAVAFALLPLICCLVYCAVQGHWLCEVYLPSSELNDELIYYKQVENMLRCDIVGKGYFGFNESHALRSTGAAWSPVLMIPWVIWGTLFGWNLLSPIICNIGLLSLACFFFIWMVRPDIRQMTVLALLFCLYTPFVRYMLSGMSESICFSMVIFFYSLAINYSKNRCNYKLILLFLVSGVMTLMRPYLVLFLLLPFCFGFCEERGRTVRIKYTLKALAFLAIIVALYFYIKRYLSAAYFGPLFFTDWLSAFFKQGLLQGAYLTASRFYSNGRNFIAYVIEGFRTGLYAGVLYAGHLACLGVLLSQLYRGCRPLYDREHKEADEIQPLKYKMLIETHLFLSCILMVVAILLMYKLPEGGRHLAVFTVACIFVLPVFMGGRSYKWLLATAVVFAWLYSGVANYSVPYAQEERRIRVEQWQKTLSERMALCTEEDAHYANTVIWVIGDMVDGTPEVTSWQLLYALPSGFGINCCMYDYVADNFDSLQSGYIFVVQGGDIEEKCIEAGYIKLVEDGGMVLYSRVQ